MEVNNENSQVRRSFFQLPGDEFEKNTIWNFEFVLGNLQENFGDAEMSSITSADVLDFMSKPTGGNNESAKNLRFALLSAFSTLCKNSLDSDFQNPFGSPALKILFRAGKIFQYRILHKDSVDEMRSFSEPRILATVGLAISPYDFSTIIDSSCSSKKDVYAHELPPKCKYYHHAFHKRR